MRAKAAAVILATAGLLGGLSQPAAAGFRPRLTPPALTGGFGFGLANGPGEIGWMTSSGVPWGYRYQYLAGGEYRYGMGNLE